MKKSTCIKIAASLFLGISAIAMTAQANDINKLDIKRTNTNGTALNVTVYTTNPYDENVAVTQRGDNKYVILIPNISGANASNVDFSSLKDVVSSVDVKSINDGSGGYTKVTLTTTKPVSISTSTRKSAPLTEEQKAYKNLIAQSRGYNVPAVKADTVRPKAPVETVNVASSVQKENPTLIEKTSLSDVPLKTEESVKTTNNNSANKHKSVMEKIKSVVEPTEDTSLTKNNAGTDNNKVVNLPILDTSYNKESGRMKDTLLQDLKNDIIAENKQTSKKADSNKVSTTTESVQDNTKNTEKIQNQTNGEGFNKAMITTILLLLASLLGITALFRMVKKSLEHSVALRRSFKENLKEKPHQKISDYKDIVEDKNLNWQEKYQKFMSTIEVINPDDGIIQHVGNGEYKYKNSIEEIADNVSSKTQIPKLTAYNKPATNNAPQLKPIQKVKNNSLKDLAKTETQAKLNFAKIVSNLERTLKNSPSQERLIQPADENVIKKQFTENLERDNATDVPVINEEEVIQKTMKSLPKLKAFDSSISLDTNKRKSSLPKRDSNVIKTRNIESKYVNLGNSALYTSAREFKDANINSSKLLSKNTFEKINSVSKVSSPEIKGNSSYSMSTVEEFLGINNSESITAPIDLSSKVAEQMAVISKPRNTITGNKTSVRRLADGSSIVSEYKINNNSGFYIISDNEGKCSLIGVVNNKITKLKDFGTSVKYKLQVRKDSSNVYIVRIGGERFLVEVSGEKMGILIAL